MLTGELRNMAVFIQNMSSGFLANSERFLNMRCLVYEGTDANLTQINKTRNLYLVQRLSISHATPHRGIQT